MSKWKSVNIGKSGLFIADGNYSAKYPNSKEFISSGVPFIRANNFKNKTIIDDELYFISPEKHSQITKGHLKTNDVLITTRGNIGELAIVPKRHENSNINAQIVLLRCNDEWDPLFLLYILSSSIVKEQLPNLTTGTALKQLPVKNLKKIILPLPPLPQQQKIANILDAADALRQNDKALIAKYDELTQALFLDMFGDPVSNPKGWEKVELKKLLKNVSKIGRDFNVKNIQYVDISSIDNSKFLITSTTNYLLQDRPSRAQQIIENGDVLLATVRPNLKNIAINTVSGFIASTGFYVCRCNDKINNRYLFEVLKSDSVTNYFGGITAGANYPAVKSSDVSKLLISLPPIDLQNQFAERVAVIEEQKAIAQKSLEHSERLFNSLLQKAFKGELV